MVDPEDSPFASEQTASQLRPMTPRYASPEQVRALPLTTATDVHGLCLLLFRLLTGRLPYQDLDPIELPRAILEAEPPWPSRLVAGLEEPLPGVSGRALAAILGGDLDAIILKGLRKEPEHRYGSVGELVEDLRRHASDLPVLARRGTRRYRLGKLVRRHRIALAVAGGIFALTLGFALAMARQVDLTTLARDQARGERDQAVQVSDFLVELFEVQHPESGFGTGLTSRQLIDLATGRLDRTATDQPELRARLLGTMGRLYRNLGEVDHARELQEESRRIRGEVLGPDHPDTLASDLELAQLTFDAGDYDEAERQAQVIVHRTTGDSHSAVLAADSTLLLAKARQQLGHLAEAVEHFRAALNLYQAHLPASDRRRATAALALGHALTRLGELSESESRLDEALELTTRQFGEEHPLTASILLELSELYWRSARFAEMEATGRRAVDLLHRLVPEEHPMVLDALTYLGSALRALGRFEESVAVRRDLLARAERYYGGDHPNLAGAMNELAVVLAAVGETTEAIDLHRQVMAMRRRLFGERHPLVAQSHYSLALALKGAGRPGEAEEVLRQGLALVQAMPQAADFPESGFFYTELARLMIDRGAAGDAEPFARTGYERFVRGFDASHPKAVDAAIVHARALAELGRLAEAEAILESALTASEKPGAPTSPFTAAARELLAEVRAGVEASVGGSAANQL
jgi:serine/threonine-protein kinase